MHKGLIFSTTALCALLLLPCSSRAAVLTTDTSWSGVVVLGEDLLVPQGVTLTVKPGTTIRAASAESSRTDPEYLSPLVELTVRGILRVEGEEKAPVLFTTAEGGKESTWAGILIDGGSAVIRHARIGAAETGIHLLQGDLELKETTLRGNRYGLVLQGGESRVRGSGNRVNGNDYGIVALGGAKTPAELALATGNLKKNLLTVTPREYRQAREAEPAAKSGASANRSYGDDVMNGETVWQGVVEVHGTVRVPVGSRLVILPGTVVTFAMKDTNGDGIGENGLLIQGGIIAKGSAAAPITFRAAGGNSVRGGWDAINIMNSAGPWNLIEHCRMENAYRGLHFHFSKVAVTGSLFNNNYRGIQFQESTVMLRGNRFTGNSSAVQARDSEIVLTDNTISGNFQGMNVFRCRLTARGNRIVANGKEGLRIREGATLFEENLVEGNRFGLLVMNAYRGAFLRNAFINNGEIGISLKNTDNMEISGNFVSENGINGMNLQGTGGRISGNLFSDNGERGVGIQSFAGLLEGNNFIANGLHAVEVEGSADVAAPGNWWGGESADTALFDGRDLPGKGIVAYEPPAATPFRFQWPLPGTGSSTTWRGEVAVAGIVQVPPGTTLTVAPRTRVLFAPGAGLAVRGRIVAVGEANRPVTFTSLEKRQPGAWDEILLEHADGSSFTHTVIEYATWGLHSHFSRLAVHDSTLRHNYGGIRFRSGPLSVERCLITGNSIGIRDYRGTAVVRSSAITGNEIGVFVREQGGGMTLTGNNLSGNSGYNLRLGDFNTEDVPAARNWWGTGDPAATIFDARQEPGIGTALIEPFLRAPLHLAAPAGGQ